MDIFWGVLFSPSPHPWGLCPILGLGVVVSKDSPATGKAGSLSGKEGSCSIKGSVGLRGTGGQGAGGA